LRNAASDAEELAQILEATGRRKEAIDLFREAAAGTDGQVAARSYADLARLDPSNAVTHFSNAVAAEEKASGKGSPRVATQLSNLALTLRAKGDLKKAEPLLRRALAIQEQAFGRRHYQTATTISNLGAVVQGLGNLTEAESLDREALAVFEVTLPKSLELAAICANLGDLLAAKGDRAAAAGMFRRAVALDESVSGPETLEVAADLISLAAQVRVIENPAAAAQYLRRALSIYEKRLGANSPQARDLRRQLTSGSH
jgi:tetratricopeptide (TPR) repeat protein